MNDFRRPLACFVLLTGFAPCVPADDYNVTVGVFAQSDFAIHDRSNNNYRADNTYRGADNEKNRNATYLPGNTIIYNTEKVSSEKIRGITQSGIPVVVVKSALKNTPFGVGEYDDVVVHRMFEACPRLIRCRVSEQVRVGEGTEGFQIKEKNWNKIGENDDALTLTLISRSGANLKFSLHDLRNKEAHGVLTIHECRKYPRFQIFEGYASLLSKGCGNAPKKGSTVSFSNKEPSRVEGKKFDEEDPETWTLTSTQWDRKAIEIFEWASVTTGDKVTLNSGLLPDDNTAIDITVFALLDSEKKLDLEGHLRFGALLSFINCEKIGSSNKLKLSYVRKAIYKSTSINEIELPQQLTTTQKQKIFEISGGSRSFLYSLNSSRDFHNFFEKMSEKVGNKHHIAAFLISRLNATCKKDHRDSCSKWSNYPDKLE